MAVLRLALGFIYLQLENVRLENSRLGADIEFVNASITHVKISI